MLKLSLLGAVAALAVAFAGPTAAADPPVHVVAVDDFAFQSTLLSAACGTRVFIAAQGTVRIILRTDRNGVVRETDAFTKYAFTVSAPDLGTSYSFKFGPAFYEYPDGVYIGAPAVVTFLGLDSNIPGLHATAGRTVLTGEVIDIRPDGVPVADTFDVISQAGNQVDQATVRAAICAALTG